MEELQVFITHFDPSNPVWWGALAGGLVALAVIFDAARPQIAAFVKSTATKIDDRVLAVFDKVAVAFRIVAKGIRFVLPLAFHEYFKRREEGGSGTNAPPYKGDPYVGNERDDRGEAAL